MSAAGAVRFVFEVDLPRDVADELAKPDVSRTHGPASAGVEALRRAVGAITWARADRSPYCICRAGCESGVDAGGVRRVLGMVADHWQNLSAAEAEKIREGIAIIERATEALEFESLADTARSLAPPDDRMTDEEAEAEAARWLDEGLIEGKGKSLLAAARARENAGETNCNTDPVRVVEP